MRGNKVARIASCNAPRQPAAIINASQAGASIADNASLSIGISDCDIYAWIALGNYDTTTLNPCSKGGSSEYFFTSRPSCTARNIANSGTGSLFGDPKLKNFGNNRKWTLLNWRYDLTAGQLQFQMNRVPSNNTGALVGGVFDGTNAFFLGTSVGSTNCALRSVAMYKRLLTEIERGIIFNGGCPLLYAQAKLSWGTAIDTNLSGWWDLVTDFNDSSANANNLTDGGTIKFLYV